MQASRSPASSPLSGTNDALSIRVAIVGAGPVGLWVAVLLARAHARLFSTSSGFRITRLPGAPEINVFERRADDGGWGSRRIVLAMSNASQDSLNSRILSDKELSARHCFAPTCSINLIESVLRQEFEKYAAAGFGAIHLGKVVEDPEVLLADHDVVFVATGRSWPGEGWRRGHGFELAVGQSDEALILKFVLQPAPELGKILQEVRSAVGRFEAPGLPMYILRPGASEEQGWLWVLGLPADIIRHLRGAILEASQKDFAASHASQGLKLSSFLGVLTSVPPRKSRSKLVAGLRAAFTYLDKHLRPCEVAPRITLASYWHSSEVVQRVQLGSRTGWIVLVGDAACGKPFYFGSNLNGHFQDALALLSAPWAHWPRQAQGESLHPQRATGLSSDMLPNIVGASLKVKAAASTQVALAEERQRSEAEKRDLKATIAELESRLQLQDEELRRQDDRQQELSHDLHEARRVAEERQQAAEKAWQHIEQVRMSVAAEDEAVEQEEEVTTLPSSRAASPEMGLRPASGRSPTQSRPSASPSPPRGADVTSLEITKVEAAVQAAQHPAGEVVLGAVEDLDASPIASASPPGAGTLSSPRACGQPSVPEEKRSKLGGTQAQDVQILPQAGSPSITSRTQEDGLCNDRLRALELCMEETRRQLEVCLETASRSYPSMASPAKVEATEEPIPAYASRPVSPERLASHPAEEAAAGRSRAASPSLATQSWTDAPATELPHVHLQGCLLLRSLLATQLDPPELLQKAQAMMRLKAAVGEVYAVLCLQTKAKSFLAQSRVAELAQRRRPRPQSASSAPFRHVTNASEAQRRRMTLEGAAHRSGGEEATGVTARRRWTACARPESVPPLPLEFVQFGERVVREVSLGQPAQAEQDVHVTDEATPCRNPCGSAISAARSLMVKDGKPARPMSIAPYERVLLAQTVSA
ncbi:unnamed protein product [Symbiodinium pilosum]|uniref:Uncharacterized protein n=1 Tax=Symbiodinium pilosum TaxID=2952 RepID=A0A812J4W8_SYMPI|nr:unnamed protein product [Symbiodinium pilosum]